MPKAKPKTGRPSKYNPDYCDMLITHMEDGLSFESFAGLVRVCRDTLYEWVEKHEDFSYAKSVGASLTRLYWEKVGRDGLYNETIKSDDGMTINRSINSSVWIFTVKNRLGWRDAKDIELKKTDAASERVSELTDQLLKLRGEK